MNLLFGLALGPNTVKLEGKLTKATPCVSPCWLVALARWLPGRQPGWVLVWLTGCFLSHLHAFTTLQFRVEIHVEKVRPFFSSQLSRPTRKSSLCPNAGLHVAVLVNSCAAPFQDSSLAPKLVQFCNVLLPKMSQSMKIGAVVFARKYLPNLRETCAAQPGTPQEANKRPPKNFGTKHEDREEGVCKRCHVANAF
jgi:hypothetical protein